MSDSDDGWNQNVVPFPRGQFERGHNERDAALEELPVRSKHTALTCHHRQHGSFVDEGARVVTCRGCGVVLDPIEVLAWLARDREWLVNQGRGLRNERDHLQRQVDELKRQERNAKSRIRRARGRRDDQEPLEQAAVKLAEFVRYPERWDRMNEYQRRELILKAQAIVEVYAAALEAPRAAEGVSAS
jgi:hypothetical protein